MGTVSWGALVLLHPSCCICISDTSFQFFLYENLFSGEDNTCTYRIHYEKYVCLIMGYLGFVPTFVKQKHQWDWGKCQTVHDPCVAWPPAGCYSQFRLWMSLSFQSRVLLPVFSNWSHEQRSEIIPYPLWHLPFWVRVCSFSFQNPTNFVTGTSCGWMVEGLWGSPNGQHGHWSFVCCRCGYTIFLEVKWELGFSGEGLIFLPICPHNGK